MSTAMAWAAYAVAISGLLACAALAAEAAVRQVGGATRWAWITAMVGSVLLPMAAYFDTPVAGGGGLAPVGLVVTLSPIVASGDSGGAGWSADRLLLVGWLVLSVAVGLYVVRSLVWLERARSGWRRGEIDGVPVWMTTDVGPAVFGIRGPMILVPGWVLELERRVQHLLLLHEREHVRAGDPRLVLLGVALLVVVPWNPVFWWMLGRLRLAVEVDCDARVLRREPDARAYGALLLEVSRRRPRSALLVAFSEPHRYLERRIRRMTARRARHAAARAAVLALLGVAPVGVALLARDPLSAAASPAAFSVAPPDWGGPPVLTMGAEPAAPESVESVAEENDGGSRAAGAVMGVSGAAVARLSQAAQDTLRPRFTPFTVSPRLTNVDEVREVLERSYPPLLRDAGIGGDIMVWFFIDEQGRVIKRTLNRSSGYAALDDAALRVASVMRFSPALNRDQPTPVWVSIPIKFRPQVEERALPAPPPEAARNTPRTAPAIPGAERGAPRQGPAFTPFTEAPRLTNTNDVSAALQRNYPPLLRDAGIGGEVMLLVYIEPDGRVTSREISRSSGHQALDDAALRVAEVMRFTPPLNRGEPVGAWIALPVRFYSG